MNPYYEDGPVTLYHGDCIEVMRSLPDASVDAVVTDPPYALEFMGKGWDRFTPAEFEAWCAEWATECLRVLKPGGHLLAFGGSRTWHRLAAGIEDAGFEIRDSVAWLYGSGFPKSLDVSKAIDKAAGAEREVVGQTRTNVGMQGGNFANGGKTGLVDVTAPSTDEARAWEGWGTALKPAFEPIVVARKPLVGTVAANVLTHGTGALNIDASRVPGVVESGWSTAPGAKSVGGIMNQVADKQEPFKPSDGGRWPTNVVLDESQAAELDRQSGVLMSGKMQPTHTMADRKVFGQNAAGGYTTMETYGDSGGASRFFPTFRYEAKAPSAERPEQGGVQHPTVKPLALMQWLVRLVTPPAGVVLEPFAGSGTTVEACLREGFSCIAIEREADYLPLILQRIQKPHEVSLFGDLFEDGDVA